MRPSPSPSAIWPSLLIAIAVSLIGGPNIATLSWLAIPVVTLSSRFSLRGVLVGVAIAIVLLLAVSFGTDAGRC